MRQLAIELITITKENFQVMTNMKTQLICSFRQKVDQKHEYYNE